MKSLQEQLQNRLDTYQIMDFNSKVLFDNPIYRMPHKFSFITLEEFCELNNILEDNISDEQIEFFYNNYGAKTGLPASRYDLTHDHNDWIIENLQSHDYKIVVKRLRKLLGNNILDVDTSRTSEKHTNARIIRISINKDIDIFNDNSQETFMLNNTDLSNKIQDILRFHNYYITLLYFYTYNIVLILEPKQTDNATNFVKNNKYVYHITHKNNINDILRKGLRPKVKKNDDQERYRYYTERLFLISESDKLKKDLQQVISDLNLWDD